MIRRLRATITLAALGIRAALDRDPSWRLRSVTLAVASALVTVALAAMWALPFGLQQRVEVQYARTAWPASALAVAEPVVPIPTGAEAWFKTTNTRWGDRSFQIVRVAAGESVPPPPGVAQMPAAGEMVVSPAVAGLLGGPEKTRLEQRLPGESVAVIGAEGLVSPDELLAYVGEPLSALRGNGEALGGWGDPSHPPVAMGASGIMLIGFIAAGVAAPMFYLLVTASKTLSDRRNRRLATLTMLGARPSGLGLVAAAETMPFLVAGGLAGLGALWLMAPAIIAALPPGSRFPLAALRPGLPEVVISLVILGGLAVTANRRSAGDVVRRPLAYGREADRPKLDRWWVPLWLGGIAAVWLVVQAPDELARGNRVLAALGFVAVSLTVVAIGPTVRIISLAVARLLTRRGRGWIGVDIGLHQLATRGASHLRTSAVVALLIAGVALAQAVFPILAAAQGSVESRAFNNAHPGIVVARTERPVAPSEIEPLLPDAARVGQVTTTAAVPTTGGPSIEAWVGSCESFALILVTIDGCGPGSAFLAQSNAADLSLTWTVDGSTATFPVQALEAGVPATLAFQDVLLLVDETYEPPADATGLVVVDGVPAEVVRDALWNVPTAFGERGAVATLEEVLGDELETIAFYRRSVNAAVLFGLALTALGAILVAVTGALENRRNAAFLWAIGMPSRVGSVAHLVRSALPAAGGAVVGWVTGAGLGLAYLHFAVGAGQPLESRPFSGYDMDAALAWALTATVAMLAVTWLATAVASRRIGIAELRTE